MATEFPTADDRTRNDPCVLLTTRQILRIYNKATRKRKAVVDDEVQSWVMNKASECNWYSAKFYGGQCLLSSKIFINHSFQF